MYRPTEPRSAHTARLSCGAGDANWCGPTARRSAPL
jgi:hypothetical protein